MLAGIMLVLTLLVALAAQQKANWLDQLAQARARWQNAAIAEYEYSISLGGLNPPPFPETVRCRVRPTATSVEPLTWKNRPGDDTRRDLLWKPHLEPIFLRYCGVDKLFGVIETALRQQLSQQIPAEGDPRRGLWQPPVIDYDQTLGYPTTAQIDPSLMTIDDTLIVWVTDFRRSAP